MQPEGLSLPRPSQSARPFTQATPYWAEAQRRQAALSTNGRLIVPAGSGHSIHWEQPTLVIDAVRQVIEDVRSR